MLTPLSPQLANVMLDDHDRLLAERGHRFVRYAGDCNIYEHSQRAGERDVRGGRLGAAPHAWRPGSRRRVTLQLSAETLIATPRAHSAFLRATVFVNGLGCGL
jgi:hypothetical protein